jgi:hypothetical protein
MPTEVQIYRDGTIVPADLSTGGPSWNSSGNLTATSFVKSGGTASQYLMADGSTTTTFFAAGTTLLFYQATAPTGWTQVTTQNDKVLRVVSGAGGGTGGTTAFTSVFTSRTPAGTNSGGSVSAHTLTINEIPSHSHNVNNESANGPQWIAFSREDLNPYANNDGTGYRGGGGANDRIFYIANAGGGGSHNHGFTNPTFTGTAMDFAVQYVDLIIASKN